MKQNKGDAQLEKAGDVVSDFIKSVAKGLRKTVQNIFILIVFLGITALSIYTLLRRTDVMQLFGIPVDEISIRVLLLRLCWIIPFIFLFIVGIAGSENSDDIQEKLENIKFCNKAGKYPELIGRRIEGKKEILSFRAAGITVGEWRQRQADLESALDCNILNITADKKTKTIVNLQTVPSSFAIADNLPWKPEFLSDKEFELVAGQGLLEQVKFDLDKYPHALIAGTTGSGKSVVLRLLLWQCILKGATPYMIDFKGGIELTAFESFGEVVYQREKALDLLKDLTKELNMRLDLFREIGVKNLPEYNERFPDRQLARVVIACDEVAEMLDKTGLSSADAAIYKEIEKEMSTIARLGRAPGINMLLGTQRPDARVIVGQIKNNLPIRISGRMTDVHASEMVLGNTKAADLGDTRGRFLYTVGSDTWEFQGYFFKDSDIVPGNYQKGIMLIDHDQIMDKEGDNEIDINIDSEEETGFAEIPKQRKLKGFTL